MSTLTGIFDRTELSPTWEGKQGWQSSGGASPRHPLRTLPTSVSVSIGPRSQRIASLSLTGIFALFAGRDQEAIGTAGAVIHLLGPGNRVLRAIPLISGRHYGDALDGNALEQCNGDGTRITSIHCCSTEWGRARVDRLEIELEKPLVLTGFEFRDMGTDASFVLFDAEFTSAVDEAVCPFRGRGGRIALSELGAIVRLRDWSRLELALKQLDTGVLESAEIDAAKGAVLTFLAVLSSALLDFGVERKLHRFQLDASRRLDALETKEEIAAEAQELCQFLLADVMPPERSPSQAAVEKALKMIDASFARDLSDRDIAERIGMSTSHFRHLFKERTGEPFHKYILNLRLERARQEILATDLSIQEISADMGFASPAHFSRAFSQRFGCSPSTIRSAALSS